ARLRLNTYRFTPRDPVAPRNGRTASARMLCWGSFLLTCDARSKMRAYAVTGQICAEPERFSRRARLCSSARILVGRGKQNEVDHRRNGAFAFRSLYTGIGANQQTRCFSCPQCTEL